MDQLIIFKAFFGGQIMMFRKYQERIQIKKFQANKTLVYSYAHREESKDCKDSISFGCSRIQYSSYSFQEQLNTYANT